MHTDKWIIFPQVQILISGKCKKDYAADAPMLVVPRIHTELARSAFSVAASSTWNSLPADDRLYENILTFKRHLKTHLYKLSESSCAASSASVSSDLKALYKSVIIIIIQQEVKVIWQKVPHRGPIPRLGVTPGGQKLYHWIPGVGFPISVP